MKAAFAMKHLIVLTILLSVLQSMAGRCDHSLDEFPRQYGERDDAPRFQRAIDACTGGVLTVPGDDYEIARTLYVTNLCSIELSPSAYVRAVAEMDWMFKIDALWQFEPKTAPKGVNPERYNLFFRGGTLDGNGNASCLSIDNFRHYTLEKATFLNGKRFGVGLVTAGGGYEMVARDLYIKTLMSGLAGNTGLVFGGSDSHFTDIIVVDYTTGVHLKGDGGANRLTRVHVWGGPVKPPEAGALPEMLRNSVCFRIDSSGETLWDCYADTGEIGFWVNGWEVRMFGCNYANNPGFKMNDVTVIRQDVGSIWAEVCYFQRNTPGTRLYQGGLNARIHWGEDLIYRKFTRDQKPKTLELKACPYNIDNGRQLFLDDKLFAETSLKRTWHKPQKDPRMSCPFAGDVWYDGQNRLYKCFYNAGWTNGLAYATSKDGIVWCRPNLNADGGTVLFAHRGDCDQARVFMDADALDGYRFKSYVTVCENGKLRGEARRSKDGVRWTETISAETARNVSTIFYDPFKRLYCFSAGSRNKVKGRVCDLAFSTDFVTGARSSGAKMGWLENAVDGERSKGGYELHGMDCVAYESVMIGLAQVMRRLQKSSFLRFAFARPDDIQKWEFPELDKTKDNAFIDQTLKCRDVDMGCIRSNSGVCIVLDDEIRFYYTGFSGDRAKAGNGGQDVFTNGMYANGAMGFATLRRDGFCSLSDGTAVTRPLVFTKGDRLWLNVDARAGAVEVTAEDPDGNRLGGCTVGGADSTRYEAFRLAAEKPFRLRFAVRGGAKLYSFWTSDGAGRSGGYLGGGSPSSKTLRDE